MQLAMRKKGIYFSNTKRWVPASWVQNYQARVVWLYIRRGYMYERITKC